ncbi:hypothetical protein M8494_19245 [Serratia ureilytica]
MISLNDYANLRSYAGSETAVMLENRYHHGIYQTMRIPPARTTALPCSSMRKTAAGSASSMTAITASIGGTCRAMSWITR